MSRRVLLSILCGLSLLFLTSLVDNQPDLSQLATPSAPTFQSDTIVISELNVSEYYPQAAFNSKHNEYLVVWEGGSGSNKGIYGQRLSVNGNLVGPSPILIAVGPSLRKNPGVDYDPVNDRYLVVWEHNYDGSGSDISGRFIPWQGSTPALKEFKISDQPDAQLEPKVEYNSTKKEFLIIWSHYSNYVAKGIMAARLKADGLFQVKDKKIIEFVNNPATNYDLEFNPARNEYLLVWTKYSTTTIYDLYMTRLRWDCEILGLKENSLAASNGEEKNPSIAAWETPDGYNGYLVVWKTENSTTSKLEGKYLSGDLIPYAAAVPISDQKSPGYWPVVSSNYKRDQILAVWSDGENDPPYLNGIWGKFVNFDQPHGSAFEIAPPTGNQPMLYWKISTVVGGKSNFLAVWEHERSGSSITDIYAKLIYPHASFLPITMRK